MALAMTSESVLHAITPGHCEDLIYPGSTNTAVQCFNAINDNRFTISLPSVNQGSTLEFVFHKRYIRSLDYLNALEERRDKIVVQVQWYWDYIKQVVDLDLVFKN
jgi:hypothetical protein